MEVCFVYRLTNKINGKSYIGMSKNPRERFRHHCKSSYRIGRAIRKHGIEEFSYEILSCGSRNECAELERDLISYYRTNTRYGGYNIAPGGEQPPTMKGSQHPSFGKKRDPETIKKIKAKRALQVTTEETKIKHRNNMLGNKYAFRSFETDEIPRKIWISKFSVAANIMAEKYSVSEAVVKAIWSGERYQNIQNDLLFEDGVNTSCWLDPEKNLEHKKTTSESTFASNATIKDVSTLRKIWISKFKLTSEEASLLFGVRPKTVRRIWRGEYHYNQISSDSDFEDGVNTSLYLKYSKPIGPIGDIYLARSIWLDLKSLSIPSISAKYGIKVSTVANIKSGKFYKMVQDDEFFSL